MGNRDYFDGWIDGEFLPDEHEMRKEIKRLERQMKRLILEQEKELDGYRTQIGELLAKNMDLTEANHIFAKGIENLKKEYIITESHHWTRKGSRGLRERIGDFVAEGKRVVSMMPIYIDPQGHTVEAIIVTEHTTKVKPAPTKLFKE